jgi:hypothetical protein
MPIYRIPKTEDHPYSLVNNNLLSDPDISLKAKGLLCYLLSKPDDWEVYQNQLSEVGPDGRTSIRTAMDELREAGYLHRMSLRDEKGQFSETLYLVFEEPRSEVDASNFGFSESGNSESRDAESSESHHTNKGHSTNKGFNQIGSVARARGGKTPAPCTLDEVVEIGAEEGVPAKIARKWWNYYDARGWPESFESVASALRYWNSVEEDFNGAADTSGVIESVSDLEGMRLTEPEIKPLLDRFDSLERSDFGFVGENAETGNPEYQFLSE